MNEPDPPPIEAGRGRLVYDKRRRTIVSEEPAVTADDRAKIAKTLRQGRLTWYRIMANHPEWQDTDLLNAMVAAADTLDAPHSALDRQETADAIIERCACVASEAGFASPHVVAERIRALKSAQIAEQRDDPDAGLPTAEDVRGIIPLSSQHRGET